ncbi:hypothetical protein HDU97_005817 [Phlyctochytrium planicorne]|nr:hypothetical protein HDU97_005817 [Phlyctochytrium planicorne]
MRSRCEVDVDDDNVLQHHHHHHHHQQQEEEQHPLYGTEAETNHLTASLLTLPLPPSTTLSLSSSLQSNLPTNIHSPSSSSPSFLASNANMSISHPHYPAASSYSSPPSAAMQTRRRTRISLSLNRASSSFLQTILITSFILILLLVPTSTIASSSNLFSSNSNHRNIQPIQHVRRQLDTIPPTPSSSSTLNTSPDTTATSSSPDPSDTTLPGERRPLPERPAPSDNDGPGTADGTGDGRPEPGTGEGKGKGEGDAGSGDGGSTGTSEEESIESWMDRVVGYHDDHLTRFIGCVKLGTVSSHLADLIGPRITVNDCRAACNLANEAYDQGERETESTEDAGTSTDPDSSSEIAIESTPETTTTTLDKDAGSRNQRPQEQQQQDDTSTTTTDASTTETTTITDPSPTEDPNSTTSPIPTPSPEPTSFFVLQGQSQTLFPKLPTTACYCASTIRKFMSLADIRKWILEARGDILPMLGSAVNATAEDFLVELGKVLKGPPGAPARLPLTKDGNTEVVEKPRKPMVDERNCDWKCQDGIMCGGRGNGFTSIFQILQPTIVSSRSAIGQISMESFIESILTPPKGRNATPDDGGGDGDNTTTTTTPSNPTQTVTIPGADSTRTVQGTNNVITSVIGTVTVPNGGKNGVPNPEQTSTSIQPQPASSTPPQPQQTTTTVTTSPTDISSSQSPSGQPVLSTAAITGLVFASIVVSFLTILLILILFTRYRPSWLQEPLIFDSKGRQKGDENFSFADAGEEPARNDATIVRNTPSPSPSVSTSMVQLSPTPISSFHATPVPRSEQFAGPKPSHSSSAAQGYARELSAEEFDGYEREMMRSGMGFARPSLVPFGGRSRAGGRGDEDEDENPFRG